MAISYETQTIERKKMNKYSIVCSTPAPAVFCFSFVLCVSEFILHSCFMDFKTYILGNWVDFSLKQY